MRPYDPCVIGDRIKQIRKVFGLSQAEAGKVCGCGATTVSNWEQGRQKPTIEQSQRLADRLGLTLDYIYLGRLGSIPYDKAKRLSPDL